MSDKSQTESSASSSVLVEQKGHIANLTEAISWRGLVAMLLLAVFAACQAAHSYSRTHSRSTVLLEAIGLCCVLAMFVWIRLDKDNAEKHLARYWVVAASLLGAFFCFLMPPGTVPDEPVHFQNAYYYSDVFLGESPQAGSLLIRECDSCGVYYTNDDGQNNYSAERSDYKKIISNWSWSADDTQIVLIQGDSQDSPSSSISSNPFWIRLPAAIGITLARLFGLGAYPLYYLGRLLSLTAFLLMTWYAIKITPVGKSIFMTVALLPMTMQLASSYSYDSIIISLSLLLSAFCLEAIYGGGTISFGNCIGIGILTILLAVPKVVYALIGFSILLVPSKRFSSRRNEMLAKAAIPLIFVCFTMAVESNTFLKLSGSSAASGDGLDHKGSETGHFVTLSDIVQHPRHALGVFFNTLAAYGDFWFFGMITGPLGWFQGGLAAPNVVAVFFFLVLVLSTFASNVDCVIPSAIQRVGYIFVVCVIALAVVASMWLGWTFDNDIVIQGVQGRYFLPVLPLLLFALRPKNMRYQGISSGRVLVSMLFLNLVNVVSVYSGILMA